MKTKIKKSAKRSLLILFGIVSVFSTLMGQEVPLIKGSVLDDQSKQGIAYATVALYSESGSTLLCGTVSSFEGGFELRQPLQSACILTISYVGYKTWSQVIEKTDASLIEVPAVYLQPETIEMAEAVVTAERIKAKQEVDKTTYFVNSTVQQASNTGVDMLRFIPGVQVDFMQNVQLEGNPNILILVDGKERDKTFLNQLKPSDIDKVEVINTPGAKYDANVSGAINIVTKKDRNAGVSGNLLLDIPTRKSTIYAFPVFNLNVGLKKLSFYGSYNGNFSYFDLKENMGTRNFTGGQAGRELSNVQDLRQKNREQRIAYGFDYFLNKNNLFSFYGFFGPYANETDGIIRLYNSEHSLDDPYWTVAKNESDRNRPSYYSLYYKHLFKREGAEISLDVNYYRYRRANAVSYQYESAESIENRSKPKQDAYGFKLDYTTPLNQNFRLDAGAKIRFSKMNDPLSPGFNYHENIYASYGLLTFNKEKFTLTSGLRTEKSDTGVSGSFSFDDFCWLPNASLRYQLNQKQSLKLAYAQRIIRPYIYQLNPTVYTDDPYSLHSGNKKLEPEFRYQFTLDYSAMLGKQYLSAQLFYTARHNTISQFIFLNDSAILESSWNNLGAANTCGIKITTALHPLKPLTLNGYLKFYGVHTKPNSMAGEQAFIGRNKAGFDLGVSTIFSFNHGFTASLALQYESPVYEIQIKTWDELLYFVSLEKTIKSNLKTSVWFAPLFANEYTYRGLKAAGQDFALKSEGKVELPDVPMGLKISYRFNSGKKIRNIDRANDMIDNKQKTGL